MVGVYINWSSSYELIKQNIKLETLEEIVGEQSILYLEERSKLMVKNTTNFI